MEIITWRVYSFGSDPASRTYLFGVARHVPLSLGVLSLVDLLERTHSFIHSYLPYGTAYSESSQYFL